MTNMIDMLFISLAKDKDIINIHIDKDSKCILEEGIYSILKCQRCILVTLLHDSSSVYYKGYLEYSMLLL